MKASDIRIYFCSAVMLMICVLSCRHKTTCETEEQKIKTNIASISGPAHINVGEQATITIGAVNNAGLCVKGATADISNIGFDTLLVTAALRYTNDDVTEDCNCKTDSVIYTLIYFKPLDSGTYHIVTQIDSNISTAIPEKVAGYSITAH
ncbi:hypothetical protein F0919_04550 [Taibaiella lutea]|uniref:Uncharacterized protein n=1 Tax=Taibaiella lutea TaxID=2608001 RepID=A0A5M6CNY9_9BACT|nr:hypothetical protein [Taibaiella lutea]KAA5536948.1 hypothetical protein F0919_04550 [Taibaiella lutea]